MFLFPTRGFSVPFFLKEQFALESSKQAHCMGGCVESHTVVSDPAIMNSEEMSRESAVWADRGRDLLPQNIKMLGGTKGQAPAGIH